LLWAKELGKLYNININSWSTGWEDGLMYCAILNYFHPDKLDFSKLSKNPSENLSLAFSVAEVGFYEKCKLVFNALPKKAQC
jgi:hypothetical protein